MIAKNMTVSGMTQMNRLNASSIDLRMPSIAKNRRVVSTGIEMARFSTIWEARRRQRDCCCSGSSSPLAIDASSHRRMTLPAARPCETRCVADELWSLIAAQRRALLDVIESCDEEQLASPSLCEGWAVRDV